MIDDLDIPDFLKAAADQRTPAAIAASRALLGWDKNPPPPLPSWTPKVELSEESIALLAEQEEQKRIKQANRFRMLRERGQRPTDAVWDVHACQWTTKARQQAVLDRKRAIGLAEWCVYKGLPVPEGIVLPNYNAYKASPTPPPPTPKKRASSRPRASNPAKPSPQADKARPKISPRADGPRAVKRDCKRGIVLQWFMDHPGTSTGEAAAALAMPKPHVNAHLFLLKRDHGIVFTTAGGVVSLEPMQKEPFA